MADGQNMNVLLKYCLMIPTETPAETFEGNYRRSKQRGLFH
jgi:hypothetical protein